VRVSLDETELADTTRAQVLYETGLPPRWYIPREDVRFDELRPTEGVRTRCPYKGETSGYWSAGEEKAIAWTYEDPIPAVAPIAGHVAFFNERVDIEVDGEAEERPTDSPFAGSAWLKAHA
jgi:uncharacterized protein (DUF427 family)